LTLQGIALLAFTCALLSSTLGCSGISSGQSGQTAPQGSSQVRVAISPSVVTLNPAARQQFSATVEGTGNTAVIWLASAGSISSGGLFTAPAANNGTRITITAVILGNSSRSGSSQVTIQSAASLTISTSSLSAAEVNTAYNANLGASGGTPPYHWTISAGSLPSGVQLQATTGALAGTTGQLGSHPFTANVTDAAGHSATKSLNLTVSQAVTNPGCGTFDGPAELPCVYLQTAMANTPAPGPTITVPANGNLQDALDNATCGEIIQLQAGSTFTGNFTLPQKSCDDQHWIIIRTSAADSSLPPEGTRITPCYAGISSLPGRPAFTCASTQKVLATIAYPGGGDGPIIFANGANHFRLLGLEITRTPNNGKAVAGLIVRDKGQAMSQIVLDRLYIHGTPNEDTRHGVDLSGGTSMAVQDSYISDFHCSVTGSCIDSQAVSGGVGDQPMGPWKIDDNFLEAAGECILFGGDAATQTPADIEIRFNHLFKPMFWLEGQPGFTAPAFIVKNHFELKNAQRVLFDSNILEDNWGGFSQSGYSILLTPKNQDIGGVSVCPLCKVTDVTIRYLTISHVAGAIVMGNGRTKAGGYPLAGERYSVHDMLVDDLNGPAYMGHGTFAQVGTVAQPLLQNVAINHVTAFPTHAMFNVGGPNTVQIPGFVFTNSIVAAGESPMTTTGAGGSSNCAYYQLPVKVVNNCFTGYVFSSNAILESPLPPSKWPGDNSFYTAADIGFVNYNNGNGGDYHLLPSSPAIGAASDGTNLGADVDAVLSAVSGVR
jgi:hypothetical protein